LARHVVEPAAPWPCPDAQPELSHILVPSESTTLPGVALVLAEQQGRGCTAAKAAQLAAPPAGNIDGKFKLKQTTRP
jgi:hypothetical protein